MRTFLENKTCFVVWSLGTYAKIYFCFFFEGFFWEGEWRPRDVCMTSKLLAIHGFLVLLFNLMGELRRYLSLLYNWWQWHLFGTRKSLGSQLCCPCFSKLILIFFFKARRLLYIHLMSQNLFYFFGDFPTFSFFFQEKSILLPMHFTYILLFLKLPILLNTIHTRGFYHIIYIPTKKNSCFDFCIHFFIIIFMHVLL